MDQLRRRPTERRAYELWEDAGRLDGRELEFKLQAEQEVGNLGGVNEADSKKRRPGDNRFDHRHGFSGACNAVTVPPHALKTVPARLDQ